MGDIILPFSNPCLPQDWLDTISQSNCVQCTIYKCRNSFFLSWKPLLYCIVRILSRPWPQMRFSAWWKIFWCKIINKFHFFICYKTPDIKKHLGFELYRSCVANIYIAVIVKEWSSIFWVAHTGSDPDKEKTPGGVGRVFASSTTKTSKCTDQYRTYSTFP